MKKTILIIAIILGLGLTTFANPGGGLFQRGEDMADYSNGNRDVNPMLPNAHNRNYDANGADGQQVPIGSGITVLVGLGAAYLVGKRRNEE